MLLPKMKEHSISKKYNRKLLKNTVVFYMINSKSIRYSQFSYIKERLKRNVPMAGND